MEVEMASAFSARLGVLCFISIRMERLSRYPPLGTESNREQRLLLCPALAGILGLGKGLLSHSSNPPRNLRLTILHKPLMEPAGGSPLQIFQLSLSPPPLREQDAEMAR